MEDRAQSQSGKNQKWLSVGHLAAKAEHYSMGELRRLVMRSSNLQYFMHLIICDVPSSVAVHWANGLIILIYLITIKILGLTSMSCGLSS